MTTAPWNHFVQSLISAQILSLPYCGCKFQSTKLWGSDWKWHMRSSWNYFTWYYFVRPEYARRNKGIGVKHDPT